MTIRRGSIEDMAIIADFQVKMAKETENIDLQPEVTLKGVHYILNNPGYGFYVVNEIDNKVISSMLVLYEWSDWRNHKIVWLHSVYVLPEYRCNGYFKEMFDYIRDWVKIDPNIGGMRLYVDRNNKGAQKLYEKIGMNADHYIMYEWFK
ncbi:MAG: GNAT family N-acetyltransferase [Bacteroidetes bacterium]|nr:GNAT family N-acetyltransferase [Bacteroidota bacterium]